MRRDQTRRQLLALLLLGGLGLLCLDLDPLKAAVADYLHGVPFAETVAEDELLLRDAPGLKGRAPALATAPAGAIPRVTRAPSDVAEPAVAAAPAPVCWSVIDRFQVAAVQRPRLRSLEDAQRRLQLTGAQAAELARIVADARRDLEDLRYVRNARGQSWHTVVADVQLIPALEEAHRVAETVRRLARFVDTELSGRGESYRQTHRRLLDGCSDLAGRLLTPAQQTSLASYDSDPVFDDSPYASALGARQDRIAFLGTVVPCAGSLHAIEPRATAI